MPASEVGADRMLVVYLSRPAAFLETHEGAAIEAFGRALAHLTKVTYHGVCTSPPGSAGPLYVVADETMLASTARAFGIRGNDDFYGGVVPDPLVATKIVAHDLVDATARRPASWPGAVARATAKVTLPGFSVFDTGDAERAFTALRTMGPVRVKPPRATGGRDQAIVREVDQLMTVLRARRPEELHRDGLVLETHLDEVVTLSIGQVAAAGVAATYFGTQRTTRDNDGQSCYAGSDLVVVRGEWDALERLPLDDELRLAIDQTRQYDRALLDHPGVLASRRNYDVAQGVDGQGQWRSGVLEHSWRIGGASSAEIAAIAAFRDEPGRSVVRASTYEVYGGAAVAPPGATVVFDGVDPVVGPILCYTVVHENGA